MDSTQPLQRKISSATTKKNVSIARVNAHDNALAQDLTDHKDNWISQFFYTSRLGFAINLTLLTSITIYFCVTPRSRMIDATLDEKVHDYWYFNFRYFCLVFIPLDVLMSAFISLILFPVSQLSQRSFFYCILAVSACASMYTLIWLVNLFIKIPVSSKIVISVDCIRLCMKVVSFLVECQRDDRVFRESTVSSVLHFILVPHLIYQPRYPKSTHIRWHKVFCHVWWLLVGLLPFSELACRLMIGLSHNFDLATDDIPTILRKMMFTALCTFCGYFLIVWFFFFDNLCGLHGELLRFPYLKLFGSPRDMLDGTKASRAININVSDWMARYIFRPALKRGTPRIRAHAYVLVVSTIIHEACALYMLDIHMIPCDLTRPLALLMFCLPNKGKRSKMIISTSLIIFVLVDGFAYFAEYIAINFSTIPGVKNVSRVRIVPVFVSFLLKRHFNLDIRF